MLCILYQFSRDLWEGKVLCIRPSLAMGIHRGTLVFIPWGIRLECVGGGGGGGGRQRETKF